jgi:hypothetical protein
MSEDRQGLGLRRSSGMCVDNCDAMLSDDLKWLSNESSHDQQ